jgi:large subunit ribosomal protein L7/L12
MANEKEEKQKEKKSDNKVSGKVQKIIDAVEKLTVLELSELVTSLEEKFGVSATPIAAAPVAGASAGAGDAASSEAAEEKTEFDVVLSGFGDKKIQVIKAVRTIKPDLGLSDAKKLVESAPAKILEKAKKEEAQEAKKKIEEAGGTVELK